MSNGDKTRTRQEIDEMTIRRAHPIFITSNKPSALMKATFSALCATK
jgi:hypothetical protein